MFSVLLKDKLVNLLNIFKDNESKSDSIIEPLTCLIRLAILEFKPLGTKISIHDNKINYNDPCILQGALRWSNGDNREDIHNIFYPIEKACSWFSNDDEQIKNIFQYSIKGLEKLKKSYTKNSTISHSISYYKTYMIDNFIKKQDKKEDSDNEKNTIFIKLKQLWNDREILIVNSILLELNDNKKKQNNYDYKLKQDSLINALESILERKEETVKEILFETTTTLK